MNLKTKQKKHLSSMQFSHLFPISNFFFLSKETLQYKETYEEETSYFLLHKTFRIYPNMIQSNSPSTDCLIFQYCSVVKRNTEEFRTKNNYSRFLSEPSILLNGTVLYISTIEIQNWSKVKRLYLQDREDFDCILYNSISKCRGGHAPEFIRFVMLSQTFLFFNRFPSL